MHSPQGSSDQRRPHIGRASNSIAFISAPHHTPPPLLPSRLPSLQRFNNGKSFGLHGARRGGGDAPSLNVGAAAAAAAGALVAAPLGGTATHSVVRAGGVPVIAATAAAATTAESGCSGRVLSHG